ncbi:MAG: hypothetical protein KF724_12785 [Phycisphaeraceae bacterium]|nr:hypothetical protein [Phycisphaeraceae bacterium]
MRWRSRVLGGAIVVCLSACSAPSAAHEERGEASSQSAVGASVPRASIETSNHDQTSARDDEAGEALKRMHARGRAIDTFAAKLELDLTRADGAKASLAGDLRMARPDRFRLRSSRFGFMVCDVVMHGDECSALLSPIVREQALASADASKALLGVLGSLLGWIGSDAMHFELVRGDPDRAVFRVMRDQDQSLEWTIARDDGRVLIVERWEAGALTGRLECMEHALVDGVPLPRRLQFVSPMGRIDVSVRSMRVNPELEDSAFTPPAGAERLDGMTRSGEPRSP